MQNTKHISGIPCNSTIYVFSWDVKHPYADHIVIFMFKKNTLPDDVYITSKLILKMDHVVLN